MGCVTLTGLGLRFSSMIVNLSEGSLMITLLLVMVVSIIAGMGLPSPAAYVMVIMIGAPALGKLGIPLLQAHLFVFYYAILSTITPPVALAAYAAASISGADMNRTGFESARLGILGFIAPFFFIYAPEITFAGELHQVALMTLKSVVGTFILGSVLGGTLLGRRLSLWWRLIWIAVATCVVIKIPALNLTAFAFLLLYWFATRQKE